MVNSALQELQTLGFAAARRWPEFDGRDSTLADGVSLARCWALLHWVELFRPVIQYAAESLAPESGLSALRESPLRVRLRESLAAQGFPPTPQAALSDAKTYDWSSPQIAWSGAKRIAATVLNLHSKLGSRRGPRVLMASYPSLRPLRDELINGGARLVFADFTRDEFSSLWSAHAEVLSSPRRPRGFEGEINKIRSAWTQAKAAGAPARLFS